MAYIIRPKETWKTPQDFKRKVGKLKQALAPDDVVPYEGAIVAAVDKIVELCKQRGYPPTVTTEKDWEIVEFILKTYSVLYPQEFKAYASNQRWNKNNQKNIHASNREVGGAEVRHIIEIPVKLDQLIKAAFPMQRTQEKEFAMKLGNRFPLMRWADKL